jgi:hypothetical protein
MTDEGLAVNGGPRLLQLLAPHRFFPFPISQMAQGRPRPFALIENAQKYRASLGSVAVYGLMFSRNFCAPST